MTFADLPEIAERAVKQALAAGASDAECTIGEGSEFSANVRLGQLETLKESGSRGAGLRVLFDKRMGASYTSDLTPEGIRRMVQSAIDLAAVTTEDPDAGLPDPSELGSIDGDLKLYSPEIESLAGDTKIDYAKRAEAAALAYDPRITNSEGGSFDSNIGAGSSPIRAVSWEAIAPLTVRSRRCPLRLRTAPWSAITGIPWRGA